MTDTTDIKALREAALKATKGEWRAFTDIRTGTCAVHTPEDKGCGDIVDWPGFDGAEGSKKQKVANAKYIAMANPQTIIALLDQLEAERQRADHNKVMQLAAEDVSASALRDWSSEGIKLHAANEEIKRLTAEIAALKGDQVPVAEADYTRYSCGCCGFESLHHTTKCPECNYHKIESEPLFTTPQKPTTDQMIEWLDGMEVSVDVSTCDADHGNRLFGKVTEVSELDGAKNGVILLVQEPEANFTAPQKPVVLPQAYGLDCFDQLVERNDEDGFLFYKCEVIDAIEAAGGIVKDGE